MPQLTEGRTESQINRAKISQKKRLGTWGSGPSRRKRCKKGKSCGATCIAGNRVCMVDVPWAVNLQLNKTVKTIQKVVEESAKKPFKVQIPQHEVPEPINKAINFVVNNLINLANKVKK